MAKVKVKRRTVNGEVIEEKSNPKELAITCEAADFVPIADLNPLQGELKVLDPEDRARLRHSLLEFGFSFPVHAWKEEFPASGNSKIWIMDAHQRLDVVRELEREGWKIPNLPVAWVHAKNKKEALKKLAASVSQYGKVTAHGLFDFMKVAQINLDDLSRAYRFPDINLDKFQQGYFPEVKTVEFQIKTGGKDGNTEISEESLGRFEHACPKCGFRFD